MAIARETCGNPSTLRRIAARYEAFERGQYGGLDSPQPLVMAANLREVADRIEARRAEREAKYGKR